MHLDMGAKARPLKKLWHSGSSTTISHEHAAIRDSPARERRRSHTLLEKHRVLATMTQRQQGRRQNLLEPMKHRQNLVELNMRLRGMHSADIAHVLDALPRHDRLNVWHQVDRSQAGFVLVEVSESARVSLIESSSQEEVVGRLTVDAVMDFVRHESELRALQRAGLSGEEDVFGRRGTAPATAGPWLAINLITAFVASRVIGQFEGTIHRLAALAALMPIVASIGGNTGNQTMALVILAIATDRIQRDRRRSSCTKNYSSAS